LFRGGLLQLRIHHLCNQVDKVSKNLVADEDQRIVALKIVLEYVVAQNTGPPSTMAALSTMALVIAGNEEDRQDRDTRERERDLSRDK
jgi:hypothetical protein